MALQVAERAVVGQDVEAVAGPLEPAAGLVAPVGPIALVGLEDRHPLVDGHGLHPLLDLGLGQVGERVEAAGDQLDLGVGVEVDQLHRRDLVGRFVGREERVGELGHAVTGGGQVLAPGHATVFEVDPLQERRDDLAQLGEHEVGVGLGLGQRVGSHPQQQRLVGLAGAVDADVGQRGGREDAAEGVEGLGPDGLAVHEVGVAVVLREAVAEEVLHPRQQLGVGVEDAIHVADVAGAEARHQHVGVAVVAVAAPDAGVVGDVAGGLLEVGHEPAPLEHLGEQVGGLLARQVDAAELGDRVVAVLEEHPVVELLGPTQAHGGVDGGVAADVELVDELVEEQPAQALGRPRVAGEQGPLDDLGQVDQGEHRAVEVREVPAQDVGLVLGEVLGDVDGHGRRA